MIAELMPSIGTMHLIFLFFAICATVFAVKGSNPFPRDSAQHLGLRLARTALALALWAFPFGGFGIFLSIVAIVLGVASAVKGVITPGISAICIAIAVQWIRYSLV